MDRRIARALSRPGRVFEPNRPPTPASRRWKVRPMIQVAHNPARRRGVAALKLMGLPALGVMTLYGFGNFRSNSVGSDAPVVSISRPADEAAPAIDAEIRLAAEELVESAARISEAMRLVAESEERFAALNDYTCLFIKRERMPDGQLIQPHIMEMKARTQPFSVYFKFRQPNKGREVIFVEGRNKGRALAHDVGFGKLLAGTLKLDPLGSMAMEEARHPVTEAGLGHLIATISERWALEMTPGETEVEIVEDVLVDGRPCTLIESKHPQYDPDFLFHMVRVYFDQELKLPIRFEAYDFPREPGGEPELAEEYTYRDLQLDVGLDELDFDASNPAYSFGRF